MRKSKEERKAARRKKRLERSLQPEENLSPSERAFELILQRERTSYPNSEGYHFIRPKWHRWVYGGAKHNEKD
jgi:hypothetical protein